MTWLMFFRDVSTANRFEVVRLDISEVLSLSF